MTIHFYLRYSTRFGESFTLHLSDGRELPLECLNSEFWHLALEHDPALHPRLAYTYKFHGLDGLPRLEADAGRYLSFSSSDVPSLAVFDYFNSMSSLENTFETQPFTKIFSPDPSSMGSGSEAPSSSSSNLGGNAIFRVKTPLLGPDEAVCLLGHGRALRNWDTAAPILLSSRDGWWETHLDLQGETFPLAYKYGLWNTRTNKFLGFEDGGNRPLYAPQPSTVNRQPSIVLHDNFARFPLRQWKGAGVAIPVFSLRSEKSWGVGEFTDMHALVDWAKSIGLRLIQLLPINDTSATRTWVDSYPYAAISAFALHPIYLNVEQLAGKKHASVLKPYLKQRKELNALEVVDYEEILRIKWDILRQLYDLQKADWLQDPDYQAYYAANKHWLAPYAAFCWLRDTNGTANFNKWSKYGVYDAAEVEKLLAPKSTSFDQIALHLFVQWHLHLQLKAATDYAHANGLAVKGDIPIGIFRNSCDAWVAPELYNMDAQAGAPPDDFAEKGQNWGFPTYNWERMKADNFAWWRQRFEQMSLYFDAFRIDHILGFFRIWSIPMDAVEGILGQFVPAISVTERELHEAGIGFDYDRLCRPYITEQILYDTFGSEAGLVAENFLTIRPDGRFDLRPAFDTQRKVEAYFNGQEPNDFQRQIRDGLYGLIANVILLNAHDGGFAFRFGIEKTSSFQSLPAEAKEPLKALYVNYFYRRQDDFWQREAMEKLPALKASTQMLICGEDLGMVPGCVPDVMHELAILSLEIQRMPKAAGAAFFHPKDAPYLSVVTPSTHDMSTLRGWWEEDRSLTQRFFNEVLQQHGNAPWYCEPWVNRMLLEQHFHSPAMWAIFQLQDLLGMDGTLRRENPHDERINVPANPKHYWRYRMHLTLEALAKAEGFNGDVRKMVRESGRSEA